MKKIGIVHSVSLSPQRGQLKKEVAKALFIAGRGIENDGHAGDWGRQVTCLSFESLRKVNEEKGLRMGPGDFAENVLIEGLDFSSVKVGARIRLGDEVLLQVTQIGKDDHPSIVSRTFGVSLLPSEGLFCVVVSGGTVSKGDSVKLED
ncbi:MAG: MOSC domain-containing protein [Synergistaceae bacterium]|nr:MOSC domain-containing protein [Synergistaceae bacterium]